MVLEQDPGRVTIQRPRMAGSLAKVMQTTRSRVTHRSAHLVSVKRTRHLIISRVLYNDLLTTNLEL